MELPDRLAGCLVGTAVGDSLLLIGEQLSRSRIARWYPGPLRHRFIGGHGMISDDTEHSFLVARCLHLESDDAQAFARRLAWRLRWWIVCAPAGLGAATLKACLRLWIGFPASRSGVFSAGNGPAMRVAIIGARFATDGLRRSAFVQVATGITHRHPQALAGAQAVAETAAWIVRGEPVAGLWTILESCSTDPGWAAAVATLRSWHGGGGSVDDLARSLGCPEAVSGWMLHSVPLALGAWLRHRADAEAGLTAIFRCGGDTDTIGAIAGAWYGLDRGEEAFPAAWIGRVADWPLSVQVLRETGRGLVLPAASVPWSWWAYPLRNLCFLAMVIVRGLLRLAPW